LTTDTLLRKSLRNRNYTSDILTAPNPLVRAKVRFLLSKQVNCAPKTIEVYAFWLDQLLPLCEQMGVTEVKSLTPDVINVFLLGLKERYAPASVGQAFRTLKTFFLWLVAQEELAKSPMTKVERPRIPEKAVQPYATDQLHDLVAGFGGHATFISARMKALILAFVDAGPRRMEMCNLRLDDVELATEEDDKKKREQHFYLTIRAESSKTRVERKIRLGNVATAALMRYLDARAALVSRKKKRRGVDIDCPYLWLNEQGEPLKGDALYHSLKRECKRMGIDVPRVVHAFRNTAAIMWLQNGGGEGSLMTMGGWKTHSMMRHYTKAAEQSNYMKAHRTASPVDNMRL